MIIDPKDDVLISELPRYIRKALQEFGNVTQQFVSYNCSFESGTLTGDAVYFDAQSNVYRRSLVGSAVREKFTGIADVERARVTHLGAVEIAGMDYPAGVGVFVSDLYQGHLTDKITTLQIGIVIVPGWLMVGQSAANARHYYDKMQSYVDEAEDQAQAAATSAAASATSAGQAQDSASQAANSASSAQQYAAAAGVAAGDASGAWSLFQQTINTVFPAPVPGYFLAWDNNGKLVSVPVNTTSTGEGNPIDDGAVGDGTTDVTTILQQIITELSPAGGGKVYLPPGSWRLGSQLTSNGMSLSIQGSGKFTTTILVDNESGGLSFIGDVHHGLSVTDLTVAAGRLDVSSGYGLSGQWSMAAAAGGHHLLIRNVRFKAQNGFAPSRKWFTSPVFLRNCSGAVFEDVDFDFPGAPMNPSIEVGNTALTDNIRLSGCVSNGKPLLRVRGDQSGVSLDSCTADSPSNVVDIEVTVGHDFTAVGCRFSADDLPITLVGLDAVNISGCSLSSKNSSSLSPSLMIRNSNQVSVVGNKFGGLSVADAGAHATLVNVEQFSLTGNFFGGFVSSAVSINNSRQGFVSNNTSVGGAHLVSLNSSDHVAIKSNTAFELSGALVDPIGSNSNIVVRENYPLGQPISLVATGPILDVSGCFEGNILLSALGVVHVNEIVGGYDGMSLWFTAGSTSESTAVYFDYNPGKLENYAYTQHPSSPPLWDDSATGGSAGNIEFTRRNGIWYETTYGL